MITHPSLAILLTVHTVLRANTRFALTGLGSRSRGDLVRAPPAVWAITRIAHTTVVIAHTTVVIAHTTVVIAHTAVVIAHTTLATASATRWVPAQTYLLAPDPD
ncbi:MAG TPA: hypothetical protein VGA52_11960 [Anaerolineales bacterium]